MSLYCKFARLVFVRRSGVGRGRAGRGSTDGVAHRRRSHRLEWSRAAGRDGNDYFRPDRRRCDTTVTDGVGRYV